MDDVAYEGGSTRAASANLSESGRASLLANMINQRIVLNVSTENFTHNRLLRADNASLIELLRVMSL